MWTTPGAWTSGGRGRRWGEGARGAAPRPRGGGRPHSGAPTLIAGPALPAEAMRALEAAFPVRIARRTVFPSPYAVPAAVLRVGEVNSGCTEIMSPWGDAVAEGFAR